MQLQIWRCETDAAGQVKRWRRRQGESADWFERAQHGSERCHKQGIGVRDGEQENHVWLLWVRLVDRIGCLRRNGSEKWPNTTASARQSRVLGQMPDQTSRKNTLPRGRRRQDCKGQLARSAREAVEAGVGSQCTAVYDAKVHRRQKPRVRLR